MIRGTLKLFVLLAMFASKLSCGQAGKPATEDKVVRDVTITKEVSFSELFVDSATVEEFFRIQNVEQKRSEQIRNFYNSRNYQFAWFTEEGLGQQGRSFWNLHKNYVNYSQDSSFFNKQLHQQMEVLLNEEDEATLTSQQIVETELQLTEHFFDFAQYAYTGKIDPSEIKWHIPRKKIDAIALLDSLVKTSGDNVENWEPVNQQYKLVRRELLKLYEVQKRGGWQQVQLTQKSLKKGDSSSAVQNLKKRLVTTGELDQMDRSLVFSTALEQAVKKAQKNYGLQQDGVVGPATLKELNTTVEARIEQLLVNMERMRWMPAEAKGKRLIANIPEFKLHVFEDEKEVMQMRIVVGKSANKTVVFNDKLKYIVFSPYWNIPRSIVRKEILPAIQKNPSYLSRNNMEQTGTSNGLPVIRQKPGGSNALGRVKFLFPNSYSIYFHDTPAKSLFERSQRAFSHGCIRLAEPEKLASYLLAGKKEWTDERIHEAMYSGTEKWVTLDEPVAVVISYFTAWVDNEGALNFRNDIYGHDKELADRLFQHEKL